MNLLSLLPGIGNIVNNVIKSPTERAELEAKLKELDVRELEAKYDAQKSWLSNNSLFVSGAIPSMLWMLVLVIFFNFILSPLLQGFFGINIPLLNLPEWYSSMCSTIVLGLFAKKAWDNTDMNIGGFSKKSKSMSEAETKIKAAQAVIDRQCNQFSVIPEKEIDEDNRCSCDNSGDTEDYSSLNDNNDDSVDDSPIVEETTKSQSKQCSNSNSKPDYNDKAYINRRLDELSKKYLGSDDTL